MAIEDLREDEKVALTVWKEKKFPSLGTTLSLELFQAFINGRDCRDIASDNPGMHFGAVLEARVRDEWDSKKREYLNRLYDSVFVRVQQTQTEAILFTADLMAAAHKLYGPKIAKFKQTGKISDLGTAKKLIDDLSAYRKVVETLMKVTHQDRPRADSPQHWLPKPEEQKVIEAGPATPATKGLPGSTEVADSQLAARVLDFLTGKGESD